MKCANPFVKDGLAFGCGQCMPCRINRRRIWSHRIILEGLCHGDNSFLTLTYKDENVPITGDGLATLEPRHLQLFFKRLRNMGHKVRYFAVGEYGDDSFRPHYHVALFGFKSCLRGRTDHRKDFCCVQCDAISKAWDYGGVDLGELNEQSSKYIAGYVVKKMTFSDDPRLLGRHREFARMSLKPGIGLAFMDEVASTLMEFDFDGVDVPSALGSGKAMLPLGRYLVRALRERVGRDPNAPQEVLDAFSETLLPLRMAARSSEVNPSFKKMIVDQFANKLASMVARDRIMKKRSSL